ncbi:hypothetical protein BKG92_00570 [Rodentibacter ratti]|uniref:Uncharacterized protein n=1 Tax=Rodentibacter ratti TaxID=1906745 RepID=A0A1V3L3L1_9PAST|nr:hypothetical protein [Rodentibacter ratti]OOF84401.1 hypothetical protein BKG92_00570 [Rodentibacter ratti]
MIIGNDTEKSNSQRGTELLGKSLGTATSISTDIFLLNKGGSAFKQVISGFSGGYVENKVKVSNKEKEENKK